MGPSQAATVNARPAATANVQTFSMCLSRCGRLAASLVGAGAGAHSPLSDAAVEGFVSGTARRARVVPQVTGGVAAPRRVARPGRGPRDRRSRARPATGTDG